MMVESLSRRALLLAALVVIAGCAGTAEPSHIVPTQVVGSSIDALDRTFSTLSWMTPEAMGEDLLYVSDGSGSQGAWIFRYPSGKLVGYLTGGFTSPDGMCSDGAGNVFVTDTQYQRVLEFAHGATSPFKSFYDLYIDFRPTDCSIDPVTGDLAIATGDGGQVLIWRKAQGNPQIYYPPDLDAWCAYDGAGNLYASLPHRRHKPPFVAVLPKGSSTFRKIQLSQSIGFPQAMKWDGQDMAINNGIKNVVYRVRFSGSKAHIVGTTPMNGSKYIYAITIHRHTLIGADLYGADAGFWAYPAGGSMLKEIYGVFGSPSGVTVSVSP